MKSSSVRKKVKVETGNYKVVSNFEEKKPEKTGRPNCLNEEKRLELLEVYFTRPYSLRQLADMFGVSRMTVWRTVQTAATLAQGA